jgi:hypothetical protein
LVEHPGRGAGLLADGVVLVTHCEVRWYTTKLERVVRSQRRVAGEMASGLMPLPRQRRRKREDGHPGPTEPDATRVE